MPIAHELEYCLQLTRQCCIEAKNSVNESELQHIGIGDDHLKLNMHKVNCNVPFELPLPK